LDTMFENVHHQDNEYVAVAEDLGLIEKHCNVITLSLVIVV